MYVTMFIMYICIWLLLGFSDILTFKADHILSLLVANNFNPFSLLFSKNNSWCFLEWVKLFMEANPCWSRFYCFDKMSQLSKRVICRVQLAFFMLIIYDIHIYNPLLETVWIRMTGLVMWTQVIVLYTSSKLL